ncbi:hemolysin family protein [Phocaeicola oris]|uniref:hemolysin family protein n=1 Tax=Phocaeicola oris TaxID=2896850 RepID=UPI00234F8E10|nr:hemolysin family protein [Phocaeicola oris]MCE2616683.1 hemolysin family protein [Phocaeicola oris]
MSLFIELLITMAFSAFFSGMEIAFVSSNKLLFEMDKSGSNSLTSKILSIFYKRPNDFISTMLVGNNVVLVIYGILMARLIDQHFLYGLISNDFLKVLIETVISTLIILVTGEFMPKELFKINPNFTLNLFAIPAYICHILLYPISKISSGLSGIFLRMTGIKVNKEVSDKAFSKVDLDYLIQSSIDNTDKKEDIDTDVQIFQNALDFTNIKIRDCMVPRTEIVAVPYSASTDELMAKFVESGISKILIFQDNIDNIIGYIHSSEMFRNPTTWKEHLRKLPIVPETMGAHKLLKLFIQQKKSLAVVVDEFGGTSGIIALEDLVEEIFGDIEDEHDTSNYVAKDLGNNEYVMSGRMEIEKANEMFSLDLPESDEYQTIAGLILDQYQSFPKMYEVVKIGKYEFKIINVSTTRIELVRLKVVE